MVSWRDAPGRRHKSAPWLVDLSASLDRIAELAQILAPLLADALDAGSRRSSNGPVALDRRER
jgi:hypothetical protein